jgi:hypothetical protein
MILLCELCGYFTQRSLWLIFTITVSFLLFTCASPQVDSFQYTEIEDNLSLSLDNYKKESNEVVVDYNDWNPILYKVFKKLAPGSKISFYIVKQDSFNMAFFPENEFLIHTGTLDILDRELLRLDSEFSFLRTCSDKNYCRELMIAPIIAHELSHFFQEDHKKLKEKFVKYGNLSEKDFSEKILFFKREREFAADIFAASLLSRYKYKPELILFPIKILKQINQEKNKNPKNRIDYYLKSHPSPNERLASLDKRDSYKNLKELENAFHLITNGNSLDTLKYALSIIERKLENFPENLELKRARVTAMHRYWMYTATLPDLKFVAEIDQPLFSDSEEFNTLKGTKKIPGDENLYKQTLSKYVELYEKLKFIDFGFVSNYAVLLIYSDREEDKKKAMELALEAFKKIKSVKTLNNLAMVSILNGNFTSGILHFWAEIPDSEKKQMDKILIPNSGDVSFNLEEDVSSLEKETKDKYRLLSLMNFTLAKIYSMNKKDNEDAHWLRKRYFYSGDNPSPWVYYLNNDIAQRK